MARRKEKHSFRKEPTIRELLERAKWVDNEVATWSKQKVANYLEENAKECFTIKAKSVKNLSKTSYTYINCIPCKLVASLDGGKRYTFLKRDMRILRNRLYSFVEMKWPGGISTSTSQLAEAGFFYEGDSDAVRCFSCNGQVSQWEGRTTPIDEHRKLFSNCEFVRRHTQFLNQTRHTVDSHQINEINDDSDRESSTSLHDTNTYSELNSHFKSEFNRLLSYRNWPIQSCVYPSDLAASGFYCIAGSSGVVECFACGGRISGWREGDHPHRRHRQMFPQCPFVRNEETGNINITSDEKEKLLVSLSEMNKTLESNHQPQQTFSIPSSTVRRQRSVDGSQESEDDRFFRYAKYQQYYKESRRLESFSAWPLYHCQRPASLAEAGFYSTQKGDETKCFYCGGGLQNWCPEFEPWEEHARWFSRCDWLLHQKGSSFVKMVTRKFGVEEGREFAENASGPGPGRPQKMVHHQQAEPATRNRKPNDSSVRSNQSIETELELALETDVAKFMLDMGFSIATVRSVIRKRLEAGGRPFTTSEDLLLAITEGENDQGSATNDTSEMRYVFSNGNEPHVNGNRCYICHYKPIEIMTVPCHHSVVCEDCSVKSNVCVYCKQSIELILFVVS
ncbi:E3 ubiquitin-protein ligase XIAP [Holothuria leucospilota]|uniref:E3 ubiquitin-protein ligase XIAP n=1 Tax=Holothuria leucospilota TaxID=206669 RepID=A0A9Q0YQX0_HOLLE|nr:E3 ubiquitin-protein ligase XIAP [Holothuria leucospilota]